MPVSYSTKRDAFVLKGCYCSWECMKAHCSAGSSEHQRGVVGGNMMIYRKRLYGKALPHGPVRPALHFSRLKMFGGDMSVEEFRAENQHDDGPSRNHSINVEKKTVEHTTFIRSATAPADEQMKMWEINNSTATNEPLRLKRQKPLKRDQNNLAAMLGLKRKDG